jgi:hypothetical protein
MKLYRKEENDGINLIDLKLIANLFYLYYFFLSLVLISGKQEKHHFHRKSTDFSEIRMEYKKTSKQLIEDYDYIS